MSAAKISAQNHILPRILLLQGPPGTGKSHTIIGIVDRIFKVSTSINFYLYYNGHIQEINFTVILTFSSNPCQPFVHFVFISFARRLSTKKAVSVCVLHLMLLWMNQPDVLLTSGTRANRVVVEVIFSLFFASFHAPSRMWS